MMGKCLVFCAGDFDTLLAPPEPDDWIIAADGGLAHLTRAGLKPDLILGDFDSLGYIPENSQVFPAEKDDTDAMLALRRGLEQGYRDFIFYGSLDGPRLDHTFANFQMLQFLADHGGRGYLVGKTYLATVISRETVTFSQDARGIVSVFCMGPDAKDVTLTGLQYSLDGGILTSGFPLGVSNHFTGQTSQIQVGSGALLVLWDRENGLPLQRIPIEREC